MSSGAKLNLMNTTGSNADVTGSVLSLLMRTTKFIGVIKTTAQNAATTVTAKIQHSPDGINWTDLISFTAINATSGYEAKAPTADIVLPFVRAFAAVTGATKLASIQIDLHYMESN
jgi:hypothetical protein